MPLQNLLFGCAEAAAAGDEPDTTLNIASYTLPLK